MFAGVQYLRYAKMCNANAAIIVNTMRHLKLVRVVSMNGGTLCMHALHRNG